MTELSDKQIRVAIQPYGFSPGPVQCRAIRAYVSLLLRWNQKMSLTTVVEPLEMLRFHFGESLFAISSVSIKNGRLADVGSGSGFPAIPLKIAIPQLSVTLIESNSKKAAFLGEVVRELQLTHVDVVRQRMPELPVELEHFDYITARALGSYEDLLTWSRGRLTKTGRIILWLGEGESRIISSAAQWGWRDPILIPGSRRRFILVGSPEG